MFDAKSLLENLVRGAAPQQPAQGQSGGGLADILGQVLQGGGQGGGQGSNQGGGGLGDILGQLQRSLEPSSGGQQGGGGLGDILGQLQDKLGNPNARHAAEAPSGGGLGGGGGLGDILGQLKDKLGQGGGAVQGQGGSVLDVLSQVLAQATQGVKEGAGRIDQATGAGAAARDALGRATGQTPEDILAKLQDLVRNNPLAAGTAMGGLGGLVLGTRTGRSVAGSAAKIGALALIGGLAYKAFQNYQAGRPLIAGASDMETAPQGSGFEPAAVSNDAAILYIRTMIAAAAADGRIDAAEQARIVGGLKQAGIDREAEEFLAHAFNNPASVEDLANAVSSPEEAVQVYTAARIAIEPDTAQEQRFLASLAAALGIDNKLAAHIDATARSAAA